MTRWTLLVLVAGCELTVASGDGKSTTAGEDPSNATSDPTDPNTDPTDPTEPTTSDPTHGGGSCDGVYDGEYGGASDGAFDAEIVESEARVYISSIGATGVLDGILDLAADGTVYGSNSGYWMDGELDPDTCALSGTWGVVQVPGVDAGWWETTP